MNATNIFDLQDVLVNELVGDVWLFLFIGLALVVYLGLRYKMPWEPLALIGIIFTSVVFAANTGLTLIWAISVLATGGLFYYGLSKMINR